MSIHIYSNLLTNEYLDNVEYLFCGKYINSDSIDSKDCKYFYFVDNIKHRNKRNRIFNFKRVRNNDRKSEINNLTNENILVKDNELFYSLDRSNNTFYILFCSNDEFIESNLDNKKFILTEMLFINVSFFMRYGSFYKVINKNNKEIIVFIFYKNEELFNDEISSSGIKILNVISNLPLILHLLQK